MENRIKMDDLGVPLYWETPILSYHIYGHPCSWHVTDLPNFALSLTTWQWPSWRSVVWPMNHYAPLGTREKRILMEVNATETKRFFKCSWVNSHCPPFFSMRSPTRLQRDSHPPSPIFYQSIPMFLSIFFSRLQSVDWFKRWISPPIASQITTSHQPPFVSRMNNWPSPENGWKAWSNYLTT